MNSLLSQVSYPVFLAGVFVFFIIISAFSFIVGVSVAFRNQRMLRFFEFMNRSISTRRLLKPLMQPRYIEPVLLKRPRILGGAIIAGAIVSLSLLYGLEDDVFLPVYADMFDATTSGILADYTHSFLLWGNALCILVGVMLVFFLHHLSLIERYTDKWVTLRRQTRPLYVKRVEVDKWVLAHPTVTGVALSLMSLVLGLSMYMRL